MPPPPAAITTAPAVGEGTHLRRFQDRRRRRARDDAAEHAGPGLDDRPALLGHPPPGRVGGEQAADRLGRVSERGVVGVDLDVGQHRDGALRPVVRDERIVDGQAQQVPDAALRVGDGQPQRKLGQPFDGGVRGDQLAPAQDEADLRPVAVRHEHPPPGLDQLDDLPGECRRPLLLPAQRARLALVHQRVPADRDQHDPARLSIMSPPRGPRPGRAPPRGTPRVGR